jgi:predicted AlkP superfamily phosphohydrolase/phosphomutase
MANRTSRKLAIVGMDSVSLWFLDRFVERGAMPNVKRLLAEGAVTQTWPCWPWETGTNWACLATGASPWVHGINMSTHVAGRPLDEWTSGFDPALNRAEPLWRAAQRAGKRSIVIDWSQSWPLDNPDGIVHLGEDGGPTWSARALQNCAAYGTDLQPKGWWPEQILTPVRPRPADGWPGAPAGALEFEMPVRPGHQSRYRRVKPLHALVRHGAAGYDRVAVYAARGDARPLLTCRPGTMTEWALHRFETDLGPVEAGLRAKLLRLSPDGRRLHLHVSQIYSQEDFVQPAALAAELRERCGPFVRLPLTQQAVTIGVTDVPTFAEEQEYFSRWYARGAAHLLATQPWDLFMVKWHTPDWFQHLTFYMLDERHPLHDPARAAEGWALWDRIMGWGDEMVGAVREAAGPDALVAIVSDHGGECVLPGVTEGADLNARLVEKGWLKRAKDGAIDWAASVAYGHGGYVFLNVKGRDPQGVVAPGREYDVRREEILQSLWDWTDAGGRRRFQAVLPIEDAGRLGVGGDRVGDIFAIGVRPHPLAAVDRDAFWRTHTPEQVGTWDWPLINAGGHADDSFFALAGPGVRRGYRRTRPALITGVVPTVAQAAGLPTPRDADGAVIREMLDEV